MKLDTRVKLTKSPWCEGIIIDKRISIRSHELIERYKVRWDTRKYGTSGWLPSSWLIITPPVLCHHFSI